MHKFSFAAIIIAQFFIACNREDTIIGLDLQDNKFIVRFDTISTIQLTTKRADSILLDNASIGLLGDYADPVFGHSRAALAFELLPKSRVINLGTNPVADSVVLKLTERSGYYGLDSSALHTVRVYRVAEGKSLKDLDSAVVTFSTLNEYKGQLLGEQVVKFNTKDSVRLSIRLNNQFATTLLQDTAYISSDSLFNQYFRGLIVEAEKVSPNGNIITIDFNQSTTCLRLHFKNNTDTLFFDYLLKQTRTRRFTIFDHNYENTQVQTALTDTSFSTMSFLQGMNGLATKVRIDGLNTLFSDDPWAINSALLTLYLAPESDTARFLPPTQIMVKMIKDGKEVFTPDYQVQGGVSTAPENYQVTTNAYHIKINKLLYDAVLARKPSVELVIYTVSPLTKPNRCVIAGSQHPELTVRPQLRIIRSQ